MMLLKKLETKFDGEFPDIYIDEILKYLDIKKDTFFKICDNFRQNHIWKKTKSGWKLRHTTNKNGTDD